MAVAVETPCGAFAVEDGIARAVGDALQPRGPASRHRADEATHGILRGEDLKGPGVVRVGPTCRRTGRSSSSPGGSEGPGVSLRGRVAPATPTSVRILSTLASLGHHSVVRPVP